MDFEKDYLSPDELQDWLEANKASKEEENEKQTLELIEDLEVEEDTVHFSTYPADKVKIVSHDPSNYVFLKDFRDREGKLRKRALKPQTATGFISKDESTGQYSFEMADAKRIDAGIIVNCKRIEMIISQKRLIPLRPLDKLWLDDFYRENEHIFAAFQEASVSLLKEIKERTGKEGVNVAFIHRYYYRIDPEGKFVNVVVDFNPARERSVNDYYYKRKNDDLFARYITSMDLKKDVEEVSLVGIDGEMFTIDSSDLALLRFYPQDLDNSNSVFRFNMVAFVRPFRKIIPAEIREDIEAFSYVVIKTADGKIYTLAIDKNKDRSIVQANKNQRSDDNKYFEVSFDFEV